MPPPSAGGASWRQMLLVFVLALLLFIVLRWHPEAWLQAQIDAQARQQGIIVQYQSLAVNGLTITLQQVHISSARLPAPLVLDRVQISPAWSSLLQAETAAAVQLSWHDQQLMATVQQQDQALLLDDLQASLDASLLQPLWEKQLPLTVSGQLQLTGAIGLDMTTGRPLHGQLELNWLEAGADMSGLASRLGDYRLTLADPSAEPAATPTTWQWQLAGGSAIEIDGKGKLNMAAANPAAWSLQGMLALQQGSEPSPLAAMLGGAERKFSLTGLLTNPRLQPL